jgi:hypothetical protein
MATTPDKYYEQYYPPYAPFYLDMAPPVPQLPSFSDIWHLLVCVCCPWSRDEQTVRGEIDECECALKQLTEQLDIQESRLRALDGLDVKAWLEKYKAWWWHRRTRLQIQEVSLVYRISYFFLGF